MKVNELIEALSNFPSDMEVAVNISQNKSYDNLRSIKSISVISRSVVLNSLIVTSNWPEKK